MLVAIGILVLIIAIFAIEWSKGRHKGVHRREDLLMLGVVFVGAQLSRPALAFIGATVVGLFFPAYEGSLSATPFLIAFPVLLLVGEFFQYWIHRFAHDSKRHPILYGMHRTHHSSPFVNVTLIYRSNLLFPLVHAYTWTAAAGFYFGLFEATMAFYVVARAWNALTHSDWLWDRAIIARVPAGEAMVRAFEWVLVTPRMHHAHHGYGKDGKTYRNFAAVLSFYDRMFGTLYIPEGRPWRYGLPGGEHLWWRQVFYPLVPLGERRQVSAPAPVPGIAASEELRSA